jgi:hypothetical protein
MTDDMLAVSGDYTAMSGYWDVVETMMAGTKAMRAAGKTYLPQFPGESDDDYEYRRKTAKFTNIFRDIGENLSAKPFTKEVSLAKPEAFTDFTDIVEDIDGAGNHLNVFAADTFFRGVTRAIDWIFVDYPPKRPGSDLPTARRSGARPYWVHIPATEMLAVYSAMVGSKEIIHYARMRETVVERDGTEETEVTQVRVLVRDPIYDDDGVVVDYAPARFEVWRQTESEVTTNGKTEAKTVWTLDHSGSITIGEIALVPFITGRRHGMSWRFSPVLQDVADLQVEHYQRETNLKFAETMTAYPVLAGNGVMPEISADGKPRPIKRGPNSVLYGGVRDGVAGTWEVIEPSATSLQFLASQVETIETQMRELGRLPLTGGTAGLTQVAAAFGSQKASSAVQMWAFGLKDALERAFVLTAKWMEVAKSPEVNVHTDFAVEFSGESDFADLTKARENGEITRETYWRELKRRGKLSADFDPKAETKGLEEEYPGDDDIIASGATNATGETPDAA